MRENLGELLGLDTDTRIADLDDQEIGFVSNLDNDLESPTTIQAIVMLAKNGGVKLVAEGIETYEQLCQLRELDCEYGQGYFFSKPQPKREVEQILRLGVIDLVRPRGRELAVALVE